MKLRLSALAACLLLAAAPAHADNYPFKDGRGVLQQFASKLVGAINHQLIVVEGMFGTTPKPIAVDTSGNVGVNCISGCSSGSASTKANASDPTLVEGSTTNQVSVDLTGYARSLVKGSVSITGTLPGFASTPTFNCGTGCSGGGTTAQGATTSGVTGGLNLGSVTTAAPSYTTGTVNGLSLTTAGALRVDNSAVTQPVSGNLTNISGTISLPTGASTSANQTAVQGTKAPGTAAANSLLTGGIYTSAGVTLTNGQQAALQFDSTGHLLTVGGGGAVTAASGAYAAGSLASGAGVDGWDLTQGTKADSAWTTGSGSVVSLLKAIAGAAIDTTTPSPVKIDQTTDGTTNAVHLVAGTALVGKVGIDQTTPGTTNGVRSDASGATGSAVPSRAILTGTNSSGNLTGLIQADASAKVSISTATTTQVVALSSGKKIYVTNFNLHSAGTTTAKFVYGTGTNCGTGTTDLTDVYDFTASDGMVVGTGLGPVLVAPASNAVCITNSAAIHVGGSLAYTQF